MATAHLGTAGLGTRSADNDELKVFSQYSPHPGSPKASIANGKTVHH